MQPGTPSNLPTIALVWAQFAAYHIDRCEAVAQRLSGKAQILAVEVATTSKDYAWEPSGDVAGAQKLTLFPGHSYNSISGIKRFLALFRALRRCDWVMMGLSYAEPTPVLLAWSLRLCGVRLVVFSESKADDRPRKAWLELAKRAVLLAYGGAIVGATRHIAYFRQLGFRKRPVLPGYDGVSLERVRNQAGAAPGNADFALRPFIFVGRFVDKKNLLTLIEGYAAYSRKVGAASRKLILAGSGEEEAEMRKLIARHGLEGSVVFPGFLRAHQVSELLATSLALLLVSREEQWGLVVNEALAVGLPVIVSHQVGSRDALVRHGANGLVVDSENPDDIADAMLRLGASEGSWLAMSKASNARAWMGDTARLADAVAALTGFGDEGSVTSIEKFLAELELSA